MKFDYKIHDETLTKVTEQLDLGVIIDNELSFVPQVRKVIKSCNQRIGMIKRNFRFLNAEVKIKMYNAYVPSIINYCSSVWRPRTRGSILELEHIQRTFSRFLVFDPNIGYQDRISSVNMSTIVVNHTILDLLNIYKSTRSYYRFSDYFQSEFQFVLTSNMRRSNRTNHSTSLFPMTNSIPWLKYSIPLWNKLSLYTVSAKSVRAFKQRLINHDMQTIQKSCESITNQLS